MTTSEKLEAIRKRHRLEIYVDECNVHIWAYEYYDGPYIEDLHNNPDWDRDGRTFAEAADAAYERMLEEEKANE